MTLQVRATAQQAIPYLQVDVRADGACTRSDAPSAIGGGAEKDITFDVRIGLSDPGGQALSCDLYVDVRSNQVADGSFSDRHYAVRSGP